MRLAWLGLALALGGAEGQSLSLNPSPEEAVRFLLEATRRCPYLEMGMAGYSVEGRPIPFVLLRHPPTPQERKRRLLVVARLHGDEPAGTTALLHLVAAFVRHPSDYPFSLLRDTSWMLLPLLNPDGAVSNHRRNRAGVDLAEDGLAQTQPESRALFAMLTSWRPHVLLDLHEHPSQGPLIRYGPAPSEEMASRLQALRTFLTQRLRQYRYPAEERDLPAFWDSSLPLLVQERFRIPALLVISRSNGIPLNLRAGVHVIAVLAAAEYLARLEPSPTRWPAEEPLPQSPPPKALPPQPPAKPFRLLWLEPAPDAQVRGPFEVRVALEGGEAVERIVLMVDGRLRALSNVFPFHCRLDPASLGAGRHRLGLTVWGKGGKVLAEEERFVEVLPP